jgi:outer membrane protein OmpA-like peptidoglycan-associated protein
MRKVPYLAVALAAALLAWPLNAQAQDDEASFDYIDALNHFLGQTLGSTRSLCVADCPPPEPQQGFNLFIQFAYDSDDLTDQAQVNLDNFAQVILDPRLSSYRFEIAGHTDASGSEQYNQGLSERRARAAFNYLVNVRNISPDRLISRGYGLTKPRVQEDPLDPSNRRVEASILI